MKKCKDCKKEKKDNEFYGVQGECKECTKKRVKKNYRINKEHYVKYEVERNKRPERKKQKIKYQKKRRLKHKGKNRANNAVSNAIRDGKLKRKPCEICGDINSQAHHDDYRKKLKVRWLCFKHHREHHKQNVFSKN